MRLDLLLGRLVEVELNLRAGADLLEFLQHLQVAGLLSQLGLSLEALALGLERRNLGIPPGQLI